MRLKRKSLGPSVDLRVGRKKRALAEAAEVDEVGEEEVILIVWKGRPRKRKQISPSSTSD